jgi:hypothetical protein
MPADTWREADLRKEYIDSAVKAVAKDMAKLKTLCTIDSSDAWTESYFRETNDDSTGGGTYSSLNAIPQMAPFPFVQVTETKVSSVILKYGDESIISLEMQQAATIPMLQRHILRMGRKLNWAIDVVIEAAMSANYGNTFAIAAGAEWNSATEALRNPVYDILYGIQMLRVDGVDALNGNGYLVVNGTDYTNIISNSKVLNHPTYQTVSAVENGQVAKLAGLTIMVSEAVTADQAYIVVKGEALVWKQAQPLQVVTIDDPGNSTKIRCWERGCIQVHAPNAICLITNTRA